MKENALQQNLWHAIGGLAGYVESWAISGAKEYGGGCAAA